MRNHSPPAYNSLWDNARSGGRDVVSRPWRLRWLSSPAWPILALSSVACGCAVSVLPPETLLAVFVDWPATLDRGIGHGDRTRPLRDMRRERVFGPGHKGV